ncbi:hypothetical protein EV126DRAFT_196030 [Verticillium dahliae]|nr:hypothetical protein EV126DRAFT_196030 [Verticillium dahliae]
MDGGLDFWNHNARHWEKALPDLGPALAHPEPCHWKPQIGLGRQLLAFPLSLRRGHVNAQSWTWATEKPPVPRSGFGQPFDPVRIHLRLALLKGRMTSNLAGHGETWLGDKGALPIPFGSRRRPGWTLAMIMWWNGTTQCAGLGRLAEGKPTHPPTSPCCQDSSTASGSRSFRLTGTAGHDDCNGRSLRTKVIRSLLVSLLTRRRQSSAKADRVVARWDQGLAILIAGFSLRPSNRQDGTKIRAA